MTLLRTRTEADTTSDSVPCGRCKGNSSAFCGNKQQMEVFALGCAGEHAKNTISGRIKHF